MALSRDAIFAVDDVEYRDVPTPEWGGSVRVRSLSGADRDAFEASMTMTRPSLDPAKKGELENVPDTANGRAKLVARGCVDDDGNRLFTDADIVALGAKSAKVLDRLFDAIAELSGLGEKAEAEAEGNSGAAPSGGSTSGSPETSSTAQ